MSSDFSADLCCAATAEEVASLLPGEYELWAGNGSFSGSFPDGTSYSVWEVDHYNLAEPGDGRFSFRADDTIVRFARSIVISGALKPLESWESVPDALLELRWKVRGTGVFQLSDRPYLVWDGNRSWFDPDEEYSMADRLRRSTLHTPDDDWQSADIKLRV